MRTPRQRPVRVFVIEIMKQAIDRLRRGGSPTRPYSKHIFFPRYKPIVVFLALCFIVLIQIDATYAQATPTPVVSDNEVNLIAKKLYCPVCQNVPLEVCETQACTEWREQIRQLIAQGYTEQQIRDYFVQRFGPQTVGIPTNTTSQLLTIALPLAVVAVIGVLIAVNLLMWRRRNAVVANDVPDVMYRQPNDDYRTRLEEELRKKD
jgi:cytochrome c-type biogenesis protein CcmH